MLEIAQKSLEVSAPIFLLAAAGYFFGRPNETDALNRVNLALFLPALVFVSLAGVEGNWRHLGHVAACGVAIVLGSGLIAVAACHATGWDKREVVPPTMFSNYGNMGLPLIALAAGRDALPLAVALFMAGNALHVTVGFKILDGRLRASEIVANPIFLAAAFGIAANASGLAPSGPLLTALEMAAAVSIPLMLFALGSRLRGAAVAEIRRGALPALLCPASGLLCYAAIYPLAPDDMQSRIALAVFAALPPALLNYMFAEKFGVNPGRVAAIVMAGNLFAAAIIPLVLVAAFWLYA